MAQPWRSRSEADEIAQLVSEHREAIVGSVTAAMLEGGTSLERGRAEMLVSEMLGRALAPKQHHSGLRDVQTAPFECVVCAAHLRAAMLATATRARATNASWRTLHRWLDGEMTAAAVEIQRAFERERASRQEAERATRAKDEFLAMISHELRTPLHAILGWAQLARARGELPEHAVRALEVIERNARAQVRLVEDLLDVHRIATGKMRLALATVDLRDVAAAAAEATRPTARASSVALDLRLPASPVVVKGDPDRLQQIVTNLLANAVKFTPEQGHVAVALDRVATRARLRVSDTGCGIEPDALPLLFRPFWQADASASKRRGGLGIGLALVRHLVELHSGTVRAESDGPGKGTTIVVDLPLVAATPA